MYTMGLNSLLDFFVMYDFDQLAIFNPWASLHKPRLALGQRKIGGPQVLVDFAFYLTASHVKSERS